MNAETRERLRALCAEAESNLPSEVTAALAVPGRDLGRFVLLGRLGEGGMGQVWSAWEKRLGRTVALKFLQGRNREDLARFRREAQIAGRLSHPNIAQVYELWEESDPACISMQFIPGATIDRAGLDSRSLLQAIRDAARALHYAHEQGVVHRDVKPQNLMIADGRLYVMDFGLARETRAESSLSQTGAVLGTPTYMSPEQARGDNHLVDARSDVYGLGATLHRLTAKSATREVEAIVLRATEEERERRYGSAREMAEDLERYLNGEPVRARKPSWVYRWRKRIVKHRRLATAIATSVLLGLAFAGYLAGTQLADLRAKRTAIREGEEAEAAGETERALAAYQRAGRDAKVREMGHRVRKLRADLTYRESERELYVLRLRSYQPDWKLTEADFLEFERIEERCRAAMAHAGESGDGWWLVGRVRGLLGVGAEEAFERGLTVEPDHTRCRIDLARCLLENALTIRFRNRNRPGVEQPEESRALELLERGVCRGDEIEVDLARGYAQVVRGVDVSEFCEEMLAKWRGHAFREEFHLIRGLGHPERWVEEATAVLKLRPSWPEAYYWRGVGRTHRGDGPGAVEDYTRALEIHPRYARALQNRGSARHVLGDLPGAEGDYVRLLALRPGSAWGHNNRGLVLCDLNRPQEAREAFDRAVRFDPGHWEAYYNRGNTCLRLGDPAAAVRDYSTALELRPNYAKAYVNRGVVTKSADDLTLAIEIDPSLWQAFEARARLRHDAGDDAGAVEDLTSWISMQPDCPDALYRRGVARQRTRQLREAVDDYARAIALRPTMKEAFNNRGNARKDLGDLDGAIADYSRAIEIDPKYANAYLNRALVKRDTADADLAKALEVAPPEWPHRARAEAQLRGLRD